MNRLDALLSGERGRHLRRLEQAAFGDLLARHGHGVVLSLGLGSRDPETSQEVDPELPREAGAAGSDNSGLRAGLNTGLGTDHGHRFVVEPEDQLVGGARFHATAWPVLDDSVDLVLLHHFTGFSLWPDVFAEASRVLRPEGHLLVVSVNALGWTAMRHGLWTNGQSMYRGWCLELARRQGLLWRQSRAAGLGPLGPSITRLPEQHWRLQPPWFLSPLANLSAELFLKRRPGAGVSRLRRYQRKPLMGVGMPAHGSSSLRDCA